MRLPAPKLPAATNLAFAFQGPRLPEGEYSFKLIKGKETFEGTVSLVADPRSPHSAEDRALQQSTALAIYDRLSDLTYVVETVVELREQADEGAEAVSRKAVKRVLEEYSRDLESFRSSLVSTADAGWLSGDEKLREHMGNLFGTIVNYEGRPTDTQLARVEKLLGQMEAAEERFADLSGPRLEAVNARITGAGGEALTATSREDWEAAADKQGGASLGLDRKVKPAELSHLAAMVLDSLLR
jgi:hypothetical protein